MVIGTKLASQKLLSQTSEPRFWIPRRDLPPWYFSWLKKIQSCSIPWPVCWYAGTPYQKRISKRTCTWPLFSKSALVNAPNTARDKGRQPAQRRAERNHEGLPPCLWFIDGHQQVETQSWSIRKSRDWEKGLLLISGEDVRRRFQSPWLLPSILSLPAPTSTPWGRRWEHTQRSDLQFLLLQGALQKQLRSAASKKRSLGTFPAFPSSVPPHSLDEVEWHYQ